MARGARARPDLVRLDVFHHLFASAAEEMGAALMRSAFSPNIKERRDFSCALFDAHGEMIAQAAHIPVHLGSGPASVAAVLADRSLQPGDAILLNDPYRGGTHLPDVTLVSPVFLPGAKRADFHVLTRAHHADIGGAHPGSMAPADDVHGEGLRIPPVALAERGELSRDVLALYGANVRVPREREADLLAQWSANRLGQRRLIEFAREHGRRELVARARQLLEWTERLCQELIASLPRGRFSFEDALEPIAARGDPLAIRATLERRGRELSVDLRATSDQVERGPNAPRAVALSAVFYCLACLLPRGIPANSGVMRRVRVLTRPGSLVDARYPAAVAAGNVETSQRIVDVLLGAFAAMLPDRIPAASAGTMSNLSLGGAAQGGEPYSYYETIAGGAGASPRREGAHAVHTHMTNTRNTPIEVLERTLPVRVRRCQVRRGSGGAGARRGGDGIEKEILFLAPATVAWVADRASRGPWGLAGGEAGAPGSAEVVRADGSRSRLAPRASLRVAANDALVVRTPGGGGHGRARS